MADYEIPENPIYNESIRKLENTDEANAEKVLNPLMQQIIENVQAVKVSDEGKAKRDLSNVTDEDFKVKFRDSGLGGEVADKVTLDAVKVNTDVIKNNVGVSTDAEGTETLWGQMKAVLAQFTRNWTAVRAGKIDRLDYSIFQGRTDIWNKVNTVEGEVRAVRNCLGEWNSPNTGEVFGKLNVINLTAEAARVAAVNSQNYSARGAVKSVQRGFCIISINNGTTGKKAINININEVNLGKSLVLINGSDCAQTDNPTIQYAMLPHVNVLTHNMLSLEIGWVNATEKCSWQIIEFY